MINTEATCQMRNPIHAILLKYKLLLLSAVFPAMVVSAQSNAYHPMPESGAHWNFSVAGFCNWAFSTDFYSIEISGDSLINGQVYHKLYTPIVVHTIPCSYVNAGYKGAFRNDTANRKVYFVAPNSSVDSLLYDFNLQPGDTVRGLLGCCMSPSLVQYIDTVQVGSSYRKRWVLDCYSVSIIEGVGSTYGLVNPVPGCFAVDLPDYYLDCYTDSIGNQYPLSAGSCQLINRLATDPDAPGIFDIFPNPATNEIGFTSGYKGEATVCLVGYDGRLLLSKTIDFSQPSEPKIPLDVFPAGVYTVSVSFNGFRISRKLIIY